jgi:Protein of unknown function (DUF1018).
MGLLRAGRAQLGWDEVTWRDVLRTHGGVESSKDLTNDGVDAVLEHMRRAGFRPEPTRPWAPRAGRNPEATVTPAQQNTMERLYRSLGWDLERQRGFNRRQCGEPWPQTRAGASKVIEGLKSILRRLERDKGA